MPWTRFLAYNFAGGLSWVMLFIWGGYWFGNIALVRDNFALVTIGIIIVSLLPIIGVFVKQRLTSAVAVPRGSERPPAG